MKKRYFGLVFIVLLAMNHQTPGIVAAENQAEEIIKKVKEKYDKIKIFQADFTQTFHWKLADNIHQQKGTVWLKGKDQFKIETEDQIIVSNGKTLWTFSEFNKQVIIDNIDKSKEVTLPRDIFLVYSEQYRPSYLGVEKIDDQDCHVLELSGKTDDLFIKHIKIWINMKLLIPTKIEQVDLNENENTYLLTNIQIEKQLASNFFEYRIPDSTEVIDMR